MVDDSSVPIYLTVSVFLFILSSLFAYSEYALEGLNDSVLKKSSPDKGGKRYDLLLKISQNDTDYIEAMHLGRIFALISSSVFSFIPFLFGIRNLKVLPGVMSVIAYITLLTLLAVIFIYLLPRHTVLSDPYRACIRLIHFIYFFRFVFYPFVILNYCIAKLLFAVFRVKISRTPEKITEDSIISMINEGQESGAIDADESEMINKIFDLDDKTAGDVMTHRTEISAVSYDDTIDEILALAVNDRYSRIPVYKETIDNIVGIIHIKDLLNIDRRKFRMSSVIREASYVPESQKLDELLHVLQKSRTHLAVVVDEYGGTAGIVTMEDILEELVGNIRDEYDTEELIIEEHEITSLNDNTYLIAGLTEIETVNEQLDLNIPDDEYDTLSGFVIGLIGEIPEENTHPSVRFGSALFTVENSNDKIITLIKVETGNDPQPDPGSIE